MITQINIHSDQPDGKIVIHPEKKGFKKYINLCRKNNFLLEINIDEVASLNDFPGKFGIHGSNKLTYDQLINELKIVSVYNPEYVIYHGDTLKKIFINNSKVLTCVPPFKILTENTFSNAKKFHEDFLSLKKSIPDLLKCVDTGHANLYDKNILSWLDDQVLVVHLNNNFGDTDTHNSLFY